MWGRPKLSWIQVQMGTSPPGTVCMWKSRPSCSYKPGSDIMMSWHLPLKKNTPTEYTQTSDIQKRLDPGSSWNPLPFPFHPKSGECTPSITSPLKFSWTDWKLAPWPLLPPHPHTLTFFHLCTFTFLLSTISHFCGERASILLQEKY